MTAPELPTIKPIVLRTVATATVRCGWVEQPRVLVATPSALTAPGGDLPSVEIEVHLLAGSSEVQFATLLDIPEIKNLQQATGSDDLRYFKGPGSYIVAGHTDTPVILTVGVVTAEGDTYTTAVTVTPVAQGGQGTQGLQGKPGPYTPPPALWTDYPENFKFQSGAANEDYRHCVIHGTAANGKALSWVCSYTHLKATSSTEPGTPAGAKYWKAVDGGPFSLLATNVMLALNAWIDLLTTRGLRVYAPRSGTSEPPVAIQLTGEGEWPMLCGSTDPDKAVTKISKEGDLYARNAYVQGEIHATSGEFTGKVTATSGKFTGEVNATSGEFTGTIHAHSGEFEGSVLQKFKRIEESDAIYNRYGNQEYSILHDLNLICPTCGVVLPTSLAYVGHRITLVNNIETYSRTDHRTYVETDDGSLILGFPKPQTLSTGSSLPRPGTVDFPSTGSYDVTCISFITGIISFLGVPNEAGTKCRWYVTGINAYIYDAWGNP